MYSPANPLVMEYPISNIVICDVQIEKFKITLKSHKLTTVNSWRRAEYECAGFLIKTLPFKVEIGPDRVMTGL